MRITIGNDGRYNFHNVADITLNIAERNQIKDRFGEKIMAVELTPSQIKRVLNYFCGNPDCCCGSHPEGWEETQNGAIIHLDL